ncbi:MAG: HNH endonuclease [Flavobacteriales bacterium]|nr:HNH endonuclease [Flavobacteriales bacterium]
MVLYEGRCAISDFTPNAVVDAAHIVPYAETSDHDINNGLLLRADLHNLFDDGLLRIEPVRMRVELSKELTRTPYAGSPVCHCARALMAHSRRSRPSTNTTVHMRSRRCQHLPGARVRD